MKRKQQMLFASMLVMTALGLLALHSSGYHNNILEKAPRSQAFTINLSETSKPRPVVFITAYQHSGSSIVASILSKHPACMFFYEPVDGLYMAALHTARWRLACDVNFYSNGSIRPLFEGEKVVIEYYFDKMRCCNLQSLPPELCPYMEESFWAEHMRFEKCEPSCSIPYEQQWSLELLRTLTLSAVTNTTRHSYNSSCYAHARRMMAQSAQVCRKSRFVVLKVLRYNMHHMLGLLQAEPASFLVHLIRDPRGITNSFIKRGLVQSNKELSLLAAKMCTGIAHDIAALRNASPSVRNRVKLVRYEQFAAKPLEFAENLLKAVSLEVPVEVKLWLSRVTNSSHDEGNYLRRDSKQTAFAWKDQLSKENRRLIDEKCSSLYRLFEDGS